MLKKYKNHLIISLFSLFLLCLLFLIPYYNIFSFEEAKGEFSLKTNYQLEELRKINNLLAEIDEAKIFDQNLKNSIFSLKNDFAKEESILAYEKQKENFQKQKELKRLEELKEQEQENKKNEIIFPKEFDITKKMAKLHIQERKLSCEAAATTDILSTILKTDIKEVDILEKMKKDKTYGKPSYRNNSGKLIWGDPNQGFVGEMDGHQYNLTGYAIYEKPMSGIYNDFGLKFDTYNKFENNLGLKNTKQALTYMLKELVKGNYVQMWGDYCTDQNFEDGNTDKKITTSEANNGLSQKNFCYSFNQERMVTWYTEDGKEIRAGKQSHNFVLLGYIGEIENPEKIIIWDTQTGKHIYPTAERLRKWELNDARAIIIYNDKKEEEKVEKVEKTEIKEENKLENKEKNLQILKDEPKRKEDYEEEKN